MRGLLVGLLLSLAGVLLLLGVAAAAHAPGASAGAGEPGIAESDAAREELAAKFAPIVYLKQQKEACDTKGEAFSPAPVEIVLGNPDVTLKNEDGDVVAEGPTAADLFGKGEGFYLDFPGSPHRPGCTYEEDFKALAQDYPTVVYAHILNDPDTNQIVVQYWLYFYFNDWNNNHESDWEFVQLVFDAATADEALAQEPASLVYAQHGGGERAEWDSGKLSKEDGHPVIYTPRGSHGSLYSADIALGKGESGTGFGCDDASGPSDRVEPEARLIPEKISGPDDPYAWITYEGRWGQKQSGEFNGPTGPNMKTPWKEPVAWQDDQRDSSVTVPEDTIGPNAAKAFCGVVAAGSKLLFGGGPLLVLGLFVGAIGALIVTARRTQFRPVEPTPLLKRRRFGQIVRSAFRLQRQHLLLFLSIGVVLVPLGLIGSGLQWLVLDHPPMRPLLEVVDSAPASGVLALAVGGVSFGLAYWLVVSACVAALRETEAGQPVGIAAAYRLVWDNIRALVVARLRAIGIILLLSITVVGIPWAIRQAVRWTFLEQAILLEAKDARAAADTSSRIVAGNWSRTLGFTIVVIYGAISIGPLVGMGVLLFTSASLSVINLISSVIYMALVPYVAIAVTMLYGDLSRATSDGANR